MEAERQHYNVTLAILTLAGIAFALQQTMVIPALPTLQRDLHTTTTWVTWVLTVFLLVASVATPILGKLGDQYGKERLLVISLALFFIGSIGAAAAWNIWSLIAWRALQGAGAAVFPLSYGIIRDEFPREKVGVAIGLVSAVFGIGGGFGIVLSGVIVDHVSWRWLFIVGAVGIGAALVLVHRFIPESPIKTPSRVDYLGATLMSGGLIAMLVALTEGESWGWTSRAHARTCRRRGRAAVRVGHRGAARGRSDGRHAHAGQARDPLHEHHRAHRRVRDVRHVRARAELRRDAARPVRIGAARGGLRLRRKRDEGGLYLLPSSITLLFAGPLAGLIGRRIGFKWPLAAGMLLVSISAASLAEWHDKPWQILAAMPVLGVGVGFAFAAMATLITEAVRPTETGVATGMNTVMRTVGGVVGGQVGAALLAAHTLPGTDVPSVDGFTIAFGIAAVVALIGAGVAVFITPPRMRRRERLVVATTEAAD